MDRVKCNLWGFPCESVGVVGELYTASQVIL